MRPAPRPARSGWLGGGGGCGRQGSPRARAGAPAAGGRGAGRRRRAGGARLRWGRRGAPRCAMDFNMKKLASDAGIFFTRAVQVRPEPGARAAAPRGPDVGRAESTPAAEPGARRRSPGRLRPFPCADTPAPASPPLRCPGERKLQAPATRAAPSTWPGREPSRASALWAAGELSVLGRAPRCPGPCPGPGGGSAEEGRGHPAAPASLPWSRRDSGSRQALAGRSPRPRVHASP